MVMGGAVSGVMARVHHGCRRRFYAPAGGLGDGDTILIPYLLEACKYGDEISNGINSGRQSPRSFGAFYPTGHLVIFFANKGGADDPIRHYLSE
jgi:hypothetical protein